MKNSTFFVLLILSYSLMAVGLVLKPTAYTLGAILFYGGMALLFTICFFTIFWR